MRPNDQPTATPGVALGEVAAWAGRWQAAATEAERLALVAAAAVDLVAGAVAAAITLVRHGTVNGHATAGTGAHELESGQRLLGQGPTITALRLDEALLCTDLATDPRWPAWHPSPEGPRSVLTEPLPRAHGVLTLYGRRPHSFTSRSRADAAALAVLMDIAVESARVLDHRTRAMGSRGVIGQAQGILMERHQLTDDQAFLVLRSASQRTQRKLNALAADLARTGTLP